MFLERDIRILIDAAKPQLRASVDANLAISQAEAEQARVELERARMDGIRPQVAAVLATMKTAVAANDANATLLSSWLLQNRRPATESTIAEAINALGTRLAQKPPLSEPEVRADCEAQIAATLADVQIPEHWSERDKKLKREAIQRRLDHNQQRFAQVFDDESAKAVGRKYVISTAEIQNELENLKRERELRGLSHSELKDAVKSQRNPANYEELPPLSAYSFSTMTAPEVHELIRRYGQAQVDARLAELYTAGEFKHVPIVTKESK